MIECGYVYILSSGFKRLYIGVTNDLQLRVAQHKGHKYPNSFTARYGIDQLVYFERFVLMTAAIAREKELKGWTRAKKIALIVASNPTWKDLSEDWGKPIPPWSAKNEARVPAKYRDSSLRSE
jgi:putative endonuclease